MNHNCEVEWILFFSKARLQNLAYAFPRSAQIYMSQLGTLDSRYWCEVGPRAMRRIHTGICSAPQFQVHPKILACTPESPSHDPVCKIWQGSRRDLRGRQNPAPNQDAERPGAAQWSPQMG